jgi:hypothetical protein
MACLRPQVRSLLPPPIPPDKISDQLTKIGAHLAKFGTRPGKDKSLSRGRAPDHDTRADEVPSKLMHDVPVNGYFYRAIRCS